LNPGRRSRFGDLSGKPGGSLGESWAVTKATVENKRTIVINNFLIRFDLILIFEEVEIQFPNVVPPDFFVCIYPRHVISDLLT
jgi:hypothetical protein